MHSRAWRTWYHCEVLVASEHTAVHTGAKRRDVAQAAGVAESTVSRALQDSPLISAEVKQRVRKAVADLGYVPSRQAARFASRRTMHIGFIVRSYRSFAPFSRAYFPALLDGAVLGADERGYHVTVVLDRTHDKTDDIGRMVWAHEVDGLLLSVTPRDDVRIRELHEAGVPLVLINNYMEGVCSVDGRPEPGMRQAFDHLRDLGHSRVGYVTGDMKFRNAVDRLEVFNALAREFGMQACVVPGDFSRRSGYVGAGRLLTGEQRPTALMVAADRQALGILDYCRDHRIAVPAELSVVGYDNFDPARDVSPRLTTVDNPVTLAGTAAAHLLVDIIEKKTTASVQQWLDTGFVVRESTARCPQKPTEYS